MRADARPVTAGLPARRGRVIPRAGPPAVTSYRAVWASIDAMTWLYALATTPGGLGITEIGLIGILADGAGDKASA